jgi:hypothetical protein
VSFCAQNGNLFDLTYENYDIFNLVVVFNLVDVGKKCRVVASPISTAYFQYTCFKESTLGKIHGIFDN